MRRLECTFLAVLVASALFSPYLHSTALSTGCVLLLLLQLFIERFRYHMLPAYAATLIVVPMLSLRDGALHWSLMLLVLVLVALSVVATLVFPIVELPRPRGPYAVSFQECMVHSEDGAHKHTVRAYYPAEGSGAQGSVLTPYLANGLMTAEAIAGFGGVPAWVFHHLTLLTLPAQPALRIVNVEGGKFPVIVFSHGLGGTRDVYGSLMLEYASHGFVVLAIEHNDGSASLSVQLDGTVTRYRPLTPEQKANDELAGRFRHSQLLIRVAEIRATLDALRCWTEGRMGNATCLSEAATKKWLEVFTNRINLHLIGVCGHSFGGATAYLAAATDRRLQCCVCMDVWYLPLSFNTDGPAEPPTVQVPLFLVQSEEWQRWKVNQEFCMQLCEQCPQCSFLTIADTGHQNFSDFPLFSPLILRKMKKAGRMPVDMALHLARQYTVAFFFRHLLGDTDAQRMLEEQEDEEEEAQEAEDEEEEVVAVEGEERIRRREKRGGSKNADKRAAAAAAASGEETRLLQELSPQHRRWWQRRRADANKSGGGGSGSGSSSPSLVLWEHRPTAASVAKQMEAEGKRRSYAKVASPSYAEVVTNAHVAPLTRQRQQKPRTSSM